MLASLIVIGIIGLAYERFVFGSLERTTVMRWGMVRAAKGYRGKAAHMVPIVIREVSLIYDTPGGKVPGVKDVTLIIYALEFECIVGPSFCGKSTLLNIV